MRSLVGALLLLALVPAAATLGLGVTTFGNPGTDHGATTIERVTKALLRPQPCK